jgi:WD40 repeat protein
MSRSILPQTLNDWNDGRSCMPRFFANNPDQSIFHLLDSAPGANLRNLDTRTKDTRPFARQWGALAFTPDGKTLIAADDRTNVFIWDVATGKELRKFNAHRGRIFSISTTADGTMFATASEDCTVMLWRLKGLSLGRS